MTEFLFGWITKPQYAYTVLDTLVICLEFWLAVILMILMLNFVAYIKTRR